MKEIESNNKNYWENISDDTLKRENKNVASTSDSQDQELLSQYLKGEKPPRVGFRPNHKYRTEFCRNYLENRYCEFGEDCCFAHNTWELRSKVKFQ